MRKAVFFDRDGVLNEAFVQKGKPYPPVSLESLFIAKDAIKALKTLKQAGFLLIGATNQPDVARGKANRDTVEAINAYLLKTLPLEEIRVCYHDDIDQCKCRKPFPGLLTQAAEEYGIDLNNSFMIGDRWKDVEAGKRAGCKTVWLDCNYEEPFLTSAPDFTTTTLMDAADWIIKHFPH